MNQNGSNNPNWHGDNLTYQGKHDRMRTLIPQPEKCQQCDKKGKLDLSNKTGEYKLEVKDWWWICRSCHRKFDKRPSPFQDKKHSAETKAQISESIRIWWQNRRLT